MRSDLNKLLCERERVGSSDKFHYYRHLKRHKATGDEYENSPSRESMKHRYTPSYGYKQLNENLNPLLGSVRKNVGRPWNKFYSELCQVFDMRSVINAHILEHLYQYVEMEVYVGEDNQLYVHTRYAHYDGGGDRLLRDSSTEYFVDPRDGILKRNKHYVSHSVASRRRAKERLVEKHAIERTLANGNVLHLIDGVWFEFEMRIVPYGEYKFTRPTNRDEDFQYDFFGKKKRWEDLNHREKAQVGTRTFHGTRAKDVFLGHSVEFNPTLTRYYHATKKTASKKTLRDAGLS